jgi:hypothetical protein
MFDWKTLLEKTPQQIRFIVLFLAIGAIFLGIGIGIKATFIALGVLSLVCAFIAFIAFMES